MAKTNNLIKLGKMFKIQLGGISDPAIKTHYRKMMIEAEHAFISSKQRKYVELKSNPNQPRTTD